VCIYRFGVIITANKMIITVTLNLTIATE
jgi:hypothetical protein